MLDRREWMSVLAKSSAATVEAACADLALPENVSELRTPEIGSVMVRGRVGATGDPFNLGEMTVTRCAVRLEDGTIGYSYVQGRDVSHAKKAALLDALLQTDRADEVNATVIEPLRSLMEHRNRSVKARADKTKVDFFTMVRGEGS